MFAGTGSGLCSSQARGCSPAPKANNDHCALRRAGMGRHGQALQAPKMPEPGPLTPQSLQSVYRKCNSWQYVTQRSSWGSVQHPRMGPPSQGMYMANLHRDTAHEPRVISPSRRNTQGIHYTQLSHDKQTQSYRLDVSRVIPLAQSFCLSFVISALRGAGCTQA